ncbi:hypothetical protein [Allokutzneria oryzae]|uniref:ABC transporter permease n=1 Tax=Allokutzneria oryzae TaxID=1378989 RepID=A0ABV5ZZU3_9PSEU
MAVAFLGIAAHFLVLGTTMRGELAPDVLPSCFGGGAGDGCGDWPIAVNGVLNFSVLLPVLAMAAGVFLGAPLLARELEQRTYRYAWTQGVSRRSWLTTKLAALGGAVVLLSVAIGGAHMWWYAPAAETEGLFDIFGMSLPVFPAVCLFGFALGVLAGALTKRVLSAITLTVVGFLACVVPIQAWWRPNYLPALDGSFSDVGNGMVIDFLFTDGSGTYTFLNAMRKAGVGNGTSFGSRDIEQLKALGFREHVSYQPADRFWLFQFIEAGLFLALAAACVALTYRLLRDRLA